jgi:hypothetical protein
MVALLDKTTRLSRGIDTIKRQIIYAALASREASSGIEAYTESIKIAGPSTPSDSTAPSLLTIGVILDCARNKAFHSYLNILENINPYSTVTPPQYDTVPASTGLVEELPTEPNTVDTLEKLLYWSGLILGSSTYPSLDYFSQASAESSEGFQIAITITLPIDYGKYLLTNNLVESSIKIFDYHILTPDQILSPWTIPPSIQFWGDPIADIVTLKESTGQALGSTHWVTEKGAQYTLIDSLPVGSAADDDLFVTPTTQAETEVWKKGGTGQGTGNGTSMTAGQIREALESLTATSRLDASAIQNLPTTQTAAQIRNALGGLTGSDRLDASAIQNLPSGGTPGADGADGADGLSAYQIWLNAGNTGTEQDFLDSLVGPQGTTGATGSVSSSSSLILNQIATPSNPGTGKVAVYAKSDGKIYKLQTGGVEEAIGTGTPQGGREVLTANKIYYVRTDGSDSNNGLTNTSGGAFLTIQKAINVASLLDLSLYDVTIQLADGTYNSEVILKSFIGSGKIIIKGNTSTPANVIVTATNTSFDGTIFGINYQGVYRLESFRINAPVSACIEINNGILEYTGLVFSTPLWSHISVLDGGKVYAKGNYTITGTIPSGQYHIVARFLAYVEAKGITITSYVLPLPIRAEMGNSVIDYNASTPTALATTAGGGYIRS